MRCECPISGGDVVSCSLMAAASLAHLNWDIGAANFADEELYKLMLTQYPGRLSSNVEKLQAAFGCEDWASLRHVARQIQGSASYVGAEKLHESARELVSALDAPTDLQVEVQAISRTAQELCAEIAACQRQKAEERADRQQPRAAPAPSAAHSKKYASAAISALSRGLRSLRHTSSTAHDGAQSQRSRLTRIRQ